jgi:hypothetical protein
MAYPHGYNGPRVRRMAEEVGYESAAAVGDARHAHDGDLYNVSRLTVMKSTTIEQLSGWLSGTIGAVRDGRESMATKGWRTYRRSRAVMLGRPGSAY